MKTLITKYFEKGMITLLFLYFSFTYFPFAFSNITLALLIALFLLGIYFKQIKFHFTKPLLLYYLLLISPFLLTILSVLLSSNTEKGLKFISLKIPILIIPILIFLIIKNKNQLKKGAYIFIGFSILALLASLYQLYILNPSTFYILDTECSKEATIIQHPYFGILQLIALLFTIAFCNFKKNKILFILLFLFFTLGVIVSTARIAYFLYIILISVYSIQFFKKRIALLVLFVLVAAFSFLFVTNETIQHKITRSLNFETSPRLRIWNNSYLVLKNSETPFLGIGIGDYYLKKEDPYWLRGYVDDLGGNYRGLIGYDSHSQYFEFILLNGVIGLLFIMSLVYLFIIILKNFNFFTFSLLIVIVVFASTETILNRQYGVVLYSFLMPIILVVSQATIVKKKNKFTLKLKKWN